MEETGNFNRLALELDLDERSKLLQKLSSQSSFSAAALYDDPQNMDNLDPENNYQQQPWYYRIWYTVLSFFNNRSPLQIFEEHFMFRLYRNLEEKSPGFYHFQKDILLPKFQEGLINLRDGSRFFYVALDASLNRDRGALLMFLGSLEMPNIHRRILSETDPATLVSNNEKLGEIELRQKAVKAMEDILGEISEEDRNKMYRCTRTLYCLKQLSSFLFDRLINSFLHDSTGQGFVCSAGPVKDQLASLNNILFSLKEPPPMTLLESLFIFLLSDKKNEPGFDMSVEMRKLLARAETSLLAIRNFNLEIPLTAILRCIQRSASTAPKDIGGGEDWFAVYKDRWKSHIEEQFLTFTKNKRQVELQNSFRYFFKGTNLKMLENMGSGQNPAGLDVKGNFALSFLQTFYVVVFMGDINKHIRPILIDGDFIKRENRAEFTECYNGLIKLEDLIKRFDRNISPEGDYGKRYIQAKNDMSSLPVKRRKVQIVTEEASHEAERIINQTKEAMKGMVRILGGILNKNDKYDTLSNMAALNGRGNAFTNGLVESLAQLKKTLQLLDDIEILEAGK